MLDDRAAGVGQGRAGGERSCMYFLSLHFNFLFSLLTF